LTVILSNYCSRSIVGSMCVTLKDYENSLDRPRPLVG
jgi:hypothetical protein